MRRKPARSLSRVALAAIVATTASTLAVTPADAADTPRPTPRRATSAQRAAFASAGKVRLAVELEDKAQAGRVMTAAKDNGATVRKHIKQLGVVSVEVAAEAAEAVTAALSRRPGVKAVTRVGTRTIENTPDDTQYAAEQATYYDAVNAPEAWDVSTGHADVLIAIIDSGVDVGHPDLSNKIAGQYNADLENTNVTDELGHGTFVAGVAAAQTDNATGVAGAGFNSRLLAVKVADADGGISTDVEAAGIVWAVDNGADIINISLGGAIDATEQAAVEYAIDNDVIVVASAGNETTNTPSYPAAYADVIAVGATTGTARSAFSNFGSWVDVGAPGTDLRSTTPTAGSEFFGANYDDGDGTSFSAPLVAGEVALLLGLDQALAPAVIRNAINSATTAGSPDGYGFAHGRVDFEAAFTFLPPTTLPTWTVPATDGTTVSGDLAVAATSSAAKVKFAIANGPSTTVDVSGGTASGTIETFGLSGTQTITAYDCNAAGCNVTGVPRTVEVDNGVPTITAPADASEIKTATFDVTAETPTDLGGVKVLVDGVAKGFDGTDPYTVTVNASALTSGNHTLTAVLCNRAGTICDLTHPSTAVTVNIANLHPKVLKVTPNPFSPNGNGLVDTTTLFYTVDVAQDVRLRIKNSAGTVVRGQAGGSPLGTKSPGTHSWVWNGRRNDGSILPDGTYTFELLTSVSGGLSGFASGTVRIDNTRPNMSNVSGNGARFYPVKDTYKDTFTPAVTIGETARLVLAITNTRGVRIRTLDAGVKAPGRYGVTWNGRRADGSLVPAGTYYFTFSASDAARNYRVTGRYTVYVSLKKVESRLAVETISPFGTVVAPYIGDCSGVYYDANGWAGSLAWRSNEFSPPDCTQDQVSDLALTEHTFAMKSAVMYGNVRICVTGQKEAGTASPGSALVVYLDKNGDATDYGFATGASYESYCGSALSANKVRDGRLVSWIAGTMQGQRWVARSFTIRYVYFVLV